jgi:hypothetical protein
MTFVLYRGGLVYECHSLRDTVKYMFSCVVLDLTFAIKIRGNDEANVKSTTQAGSPLGKVA